MKMTQALYDAGVFMIEVEAHTVSVVDPDTESVGERPIGTYTVKLGVSGTPEDIRTAINLFVETAIDKEQLGSTGGKASESESS